MWRDALLVALGALVIWLVLADHHRTVVDDLENELRAAEDDLRIAQGGPGIPWRQATVFRTNRLPSLAPRRPHPPVPIVHRPVRVLPPLADIAPWPDPPRRVWTIPIRPTTDELHRIVYGPEGILA